MPVLPQLPQIKTAPKPTITQERFRLLGTDNGAAFITVDSYADNGGNVIENVDTSLRSIPGSDNVTGLRAPNIPAFITAFAEE